MRALSRTVFMLGVAAMLVGLASGVINRQVLDPDRFASHVDAVRADPGVARAVGGLVTERLLETEPDLVIFRPLIESASATVIASPTLGPVIRATVAPLHRALTSGDDGQIVLQLADVGALLVAAINTLAPSTEAVIPTGLDVQLARIGGHEFSTELIGVAHLVGVLSWLLPLVGVLLMIAAGAMLRRDVRGMGRSVGHGLLTTAAAMAVLMLLGAWLTTSDDAAGVARTVVSAVWGELDESFWLTAGVAAVAGFLLVVVSSPGFVLDPSTMLARARGWLARRRSSAKDRAVGGVVAVALGCLVVARPLGVLATVVTVGGLLLVLSGLRDLVQVVATFVRSVARTAASTKVATYDLGTRVVAGFSVVVLAIVVVVGAIPSSGQLSASAEQTATGGPCNGHDELCARPYDQVSFPATHNSM